MPNAAQIEEIARNEMGLGIDGQREPDSGKIASGSKISEKTVFIKSLKEQSQFKTLNPAQDYIDNKIYFAIKVGGDQYLINSDREYFYFKDAAKYGFNLATNNVSTCLFSVEGIGAFIEDRYSIDPFDLYDRIYKYIKQYVFFIDDRYIAYLSLWVIGTYFHRCFSHYPYVWINAEKQSGKSLLMKVLSRIAFNGVIIIDPTAAIIFRDVAANSVTQFFDEMEQLTKHDKENRNAIFAIFNSGFEKGTSVKRAEKIKSGGFDIREFSTYSPKMFAGINSIDEVLRDRTVKLRMMRKKPDEHVDRYKETKMNLEYQAKLRDDLYFFALKHGPEVAKIYEDGQFNLHHLSDREKDIWEPIIAIAEFFNGISGDNSIITTLTSLSKDLGAEKHTDGIEENETCQLLRIFKTLMEELEPVKIDGEKTLYDRHEVFGYFRKTDEFGWLKENQINTLTNRFKKIGIAASERRIDGGKKDRYYCLNPIDFENLYERYVKKSDKE